MVQQESKAQEIMDLGENKWLQSTMFLNHCILLLIMKVSSELGEDYSIPPFIIKDDIRCFFQGINILPG